MAVIIPAIRLIDDAGATVWDASLLPAISLEEGEQIKNVVAKLAVETERLEPKRWTKNATTGE